MTIKIFKKSGNSRWARFFQIENVKPCPILQSVENFPIVKDVFKFYLKSFPKLPKTCPILPGNYGFNEYPIGVSQNETRNMLSLKLTTGLYRHVLKVSIPEEKDIFLLYWLIQIINEEE